MEVGMDVLQLVAEGANRLREYFPGCSVTVEDNIVDVDDLWLTVHTDMETGEAIRRLRKFDKDWWLDNIRRCGNRLSIDYCPVDAGPLWADAEGVVRRDAGRLGGSRGATRGICRMSDLLADLCKAGRAQDDADTLHAKAMWSLIHDRDATIASQAARITALENAGRAVCDIHDAWDDTYADWPAHMKSAVKDIRALLPDATPSESTTASDEADGG
jgi:hypothetical protein